MSERPYVGIAFGIAALLLALYMLKPSAPATISRTFFTADDGKTFYLDDVKLIPPYTANGRTGVLAYVYRCPTCGKEFVGNMGRYRPDRAEAMRQWVASQPKPGSGKPLAITPAPQADLEMKRPGEPESAWKVPGMPADVQAAMAQAASGANLIHCPDHPTVVAQPVLP